LETGSPQANASIKIQRSLRFIETAQEARQAERGPTVRNVLVWSTGLIIVAFAIVWFSFFRT